MGVCNHHDYSSFRSSTSLVAHELKDVKARRIIMDVVKDHIVSHITNKDSAFEMWTALMNLYQSQNLKMMLREKLKYTMITELDITVSHVTKDSESFEMNLELLR